MSRLPLLIVLAGLALSLADLRVGPIVWASAPVVVYLAVAYTYRRNLGWWSLVGVFSTAVAILSALLKVGG
ncbi:MAG: hypothetical protein GXO29_07280 [Thermotogae bacterium]|nr:hypothetical protein [Thermotogota bacterium]